MPGPIERRKLRPDERAEGALADRLVTAVVTAVREESDRIVAEGGQRLPGTLLVSVLLTALGLAIDQAARTTHDRRELAESCEQLLHAHAAQPWNLASIPVPRRFM